MKLPWLSNIVESINANYKKIADFEKLKIHDLTTEVKNYAKALLEDVKRALYGQGPYQLAKGYKKFQVSFQTWQGWTEEERDQHFQKFVDFLIRKEVDRSVGEYGLNIKDKTTTAKKQNQGSSSTKTERVNRRGRPPKQGGVQGRETKDDVGSVKSEGNLSKLAISYHHNMIFNVLLLYFAAKLLHNGIFGIF